MDKKEVINKIKEMLNFNNDEIKIELMEVKDTDGRVISYEGEDIEVGKAVTITLLDGETLGTEYVLEDGRTIIIDENSIITEIKEVPVEVIDETPVVEETMAEVEVEPLQDAIVGVEEAPINTLVNEIQDEINETEDQNNSEVIMIKRMDNLEDLVRKMLEKQAKLIDANVEMAKIIEVYGNETTNEDIKLSKQLTEIEKKKSSFEMSLESIKNIRNNK